MNKSFLFSIIVPVYKVELYVEKCVRSVLSQTYPHFELILVDDGSPDNCPMICDELVTIDSRIIVIHKKNGGASDARNEGIKRSKGDYILFIDSDDFWNDDKALANVAKKIEKRKGNIDLILFGCRVYNCVTQSESLSRCGYNEDLFSSDDKERILEYLFKANLFPGSAWITITKRTFLVENNLFFINGIKAEDLDWLLGVLVCAKKIDALNMPFYTYLKFRNGTVTGTADAKSVEDILYTLDKWSIKLISSPRRSDLILRGFLSYIYIVCVMLYVKIGYKNATLGERILKHKELLKSAIGLRTSLMALVLRIGGITLGGSILNVIYNLKKK